MNKKRISLFLAMCLLFLDISLAFATITYLVPKETQLGQGFFVRITANDILDDVMFTWQGKDIRPVKTFWDDKHVYYAFVGTDVLHHKIDTYPFVFSFEQNGEKTRKEFIVTAQKKEYPVQSLTVSGNMVTPPATVLNQIHKDRTTNLAILGNISAPNTVGHTYPFLRPVKGITTSAYGLRRVFNNIPKNSHRGLDFRGAVGTPIHAIADGEVVLSENQYYGGNTTYIDHGAGLISIYLHQSEMFTKKGQKVKRGDVIGKVGMTGRVTGPHLHFSIALQGFLVDPAPFFDKSIQEWTK